MRVFLALVALLYGVIWSIESYTSRDIYGKSNVSKHFISKRAKLMLVVDEYGDLEGVLTLEDVIENLIGADLLDERDTQ